MKIYTAITRADNYIKLSNDEETVTIPAAAYVAVDDNSGYISVKNTATRKTFGLIKKNVTPPTPPTPTHDYSQDYFTIISREDNNAIVFGEDGSTMESYYLTISASTDNGETWTSYTSTSGAGTTIATLNTGEKVLVKGENNSYFSYEYSRGNYFDGSKTFDVEGNVMSLINGDNFTGATELTSYRSFHALLSWSKVVSAENLVIPVVNQHTCSYMFGRCTSLTTAPKTLSATTLSTGSYMNMFQDCTSLTTAPELPATTLAMGCYYQMFKGCSNLNYIKMLATDASATNSLYHWVDGVAATGTFVKSSAATLAEGVSGIPAGWTVQEV